MNKNIERIASSFNFKLIIVLLIIVCLFIFYQLSQKNRYQLKGNLVFDTQTGDSRSRITFVNSPSRPSLADWDNIKNSDEYKKHSPQEQSIIASSWFKENIAPTPEFNELNENDRAAILRVFIKEATAPKTIK